MSENRSLCEINDAKSEGRWILIGDVTEPYTLLPGDRIEIRLTETRGPGDPCTRLA